MKDCKRCGQVKTWSGENPICPFMRGDVFGENWNCGVINEIRDLCDLAMEGKDYRLHYQYCDDQKYAIIKTDCIAQDNDSEEDIDVGMALWVTWYKRRGATDKMYILDSYNEPRVPTFDQLKTIVDYYKKVTQPA